ncbi:MAG TPA: hypothetical protein VMV26_16325 [Alphaproteobacteria bacterium]|jgi:hypothetical protein|nr:hypothetical protein [Alphaproteobacteria bacterium]
MRIRVVTIAGTAAMAALLASGAATAQMQSTPTSPPRPDCSTFAPNTEAYRDCLAGQVPGGPGRRGTSPDTLQRSPSDPSGRMMPGTTPTSPPVSPGDPTGQQGTAPTSPGVVPPGAPSGETGR